MEEFIKLICNIYGDPEQSIELRMTVGDMCSDDYKRRFKAEYRQLAYRYKKISKFICDFECGKEQLTCSLPLLIKQRDAMALYLACLYERSLTEGVDLV